MEIRGLIARIDERLAKLGLSATEASRRATGSTDTIRNWRRTAANGKGSLPTITTLEAVARVLGTNYMWLADGIGNEEGDGKEAGVVRDVPMVSWVTAGEMASQEAIATLTEYPTIPAVDIKGNGPFIALRVEPNANSMNKISPPESVIFVDMGDKRLVPNACYVIADDQGQATYKRYRPDLKPPFQPASYDKVPPPTLEGAIRVVGRVRRSMIDM